MNNIYKKIAAAVFVSLFALTAAWAGNGKKALEKTKEAGNETGKELSKAGSKTGKAVAKTGNEAGKEISKAADKVKGAFK